MKILKAKIKKCSIHYKNGVNRKGKAIWLSILDFNPRGTHNYKLKAVKGIKNGFAEYIDVWVSPNDITIKQHEDGQLTLDIFSPQEIEENKTNPKYFNQRRFEYTISNELQDYLKPNFIIHLENLNFIDLVFKPLIEKYYFSAPDFEIAQKIIHEYNLPKGNLIQVIKLTKKQLDEY